MSVSHLTTEAKRMIIMVIRLLLIYFLTAGIWAVIERLKPSSEIINIPINFVVLESIGDSITTKKYQPENQCNSSQHLVADMAPKSTEKIGHSDFSYTMKSNGDEGVYVRIDGGVYRYEYIIKNGCIHPLKQKSYSLWILLLAFAFSVGIIHFLPRFIRQRMIRKT